MILVCTAKGRIGYRTIERMVDLVGAGQVVAGVRSPEKAKDLTERGIEVRVVDYDDPVGMEKAFQGVDRLVLVPSFADTETRAQQGRNVIRAAVTAKVRQVIFVGIMDTRSDSPLPFAHAYGQIEDAFHASDLDFTILRTSMYTDNLAEQYPKWLENGELVTCAGDGRISYISRDDIAAAISGVLTAPIELHARETYTITGPEALSYDEVAEVISEHFGKPIKVTHVEREEFADRLKKVWGVAYEGLEHVAKVTPLFQTVFKQGLMAPVTNDVERLSGKRPETVKTWLVRHTPVEAT